MVSPITQSKTLCNIFNNNSTNSTVYLYPWLINQEVFSTSCYCLCGNSVRKLDDLFYTFLLFQHKIRAFLNTKTCTLLTTQQQILLTPSSWDSGLLTTRSCWPAAFRGLVMCCDKTQLQSQSLKPVTAQWSLISCITTQTILTWAMY